MAPLLVTDKTGGEVDNPPLNRKEFFKNFPKKIAETFHAVKDNPGDSSTRVACIDIAACLAWSGTTCQICYLSCPRRDEAIQIWCEKPVIAVAACDGCGICQGTCRNVNNLEAIRMVSPQ